MKVTTNIKSGSLLQDAMQSASNLSDQAGRFVATAEMQAENLTGAVSNSANNLWQGLTGLFR